MAARTFRDDDEEAQFCLVVLRDGTDDEKLTARERLATIFARRGLFTEVVALYELNVRAGDRSPELFERLSEAYRQLGDHAAAGAALAEAQQRRREPTPSSPTPGPFTPPPEAVTPTPAPGLQQGATPPPPTVPSVTAPDVTAKLTAQASAPEPPLIRGTVAPRSGRSLPGPLRFIVTVLGAIVVPVIVLTLFVVNPIALYLEGRAAGPTIDGQAATPAQPAQINVAPGADASWYLRVGRSVSGIWASPALELTLDQEIAGVGRAFTVTASRPQSWGETITLVERRGQGRSNQNTIVPATLSMPATLPPVGTVLAGRISGQIIAPRLTESGQFNTTTEAVDLPVHLVVVSTPALWWDRFINALSMFFDEDRWLLVTIGALLTWCVLAGVVALVFRAGRR